MTDLKSPDRPLTFWKSAGRKPAGTSRAHRRGPRAAGRILLVAAVAFCGWSGWSYWQSTQDESLNFAKVRDQVQRAARQEIADLNTIDAAQVDAGLRRWLSASTGPLHDELSDTMAQSKLKISQAGSSAQGTVTDLAVTELDTRAGTAQVIATVQIKTNPAPVGRSGDDRQRFSAVLKRTGEGWKLGSLTAVPVSAN